MSKLRLIVSLTFILTLVSATGCNDSGGKSKTNPVSENPRSNFCNSLPN